MPEFSLDGLIRACVLYLCICGPENTWDGILLQSHCNKSFVSCLLKLHLCKYCLLEKDLSCQTTEADKYPVSNIYLLVRLANGVEERYSAS